MYVASQTCIALCVTDRRAALVRNDQCGGLESPGSADITTVILSNFEVTNLLYEPSSLGPHPTTRMLRIKSVWSIQTFAVHKHLQVQGGGLDPLWEKWPEMISDAH